MPIDIKVLCRDLTPEKTTLLFGAGSSIPSGAPSGIDLRNYLIKQFKLHMDETLTLSEVATIIERKHSRRDLIDALRDKIGKLVPTGGLLNLHQYPWKGIYTTNYDTLVEKVYQKGSKKLKTYSSNFDFGGGDVLDATEYFKLHGSIDKDVSDGHNSRIIVSVSDYSLTDDYREQLYERFQHEISTGSLVIIGHALSDPDLKVIIDEAIRRKSTSGGQAKITLFLYTKDENRAFIYEELGIQVCFGGLDDFFTELAKHGPDMQLVLSVTSDPIDCATEIRPCTLDVAHAKASERANLIQMFNGKPANYAEISREWTFERDQALQIETMLADDEHWIAIILGSAGVGKTTMARQALNRLLDRDIKCWEHKNDFDFPSAGWVKVDAELRKRGEQGVIFIDNAHSHIREINKLVDEIGRHGKPALKVLLTSSRPHWNPRLKSPVMFNKGIQFPVSELSETEINKLLDLLDDKRDIKELVGDKFLGFSRPERRRRLIERCDKDMFVCLKNIFSFEGINLIILKEYADLPEDLQQIYRNVAAMEAAGVRVHRQMVMRVVGLEASQIQRTLDDMEGIIEEYTVSAKLGIYGWCIRHSVIADIIAEHKYDSQEEIYGLLGKVVRSINPSYQIEVKSIRDICDMNKGIGRLLDKSKQNILLRRLISHAPGERVPRHRLITNLIRQEEFEIAENEIRIFEKEIGIDGPVQRYKVKLQLAMAKSADGIMDTDRASMTKKAAVLAEKGIDNHSEDKNMYAVYFEAGVQYFKYSGELEIFEDAMTRANKAQDAILDPDLGRIISRYDRVYERMIGKGKI